MPPRTLTAVAACLKNEGQFLLEWVAHQRGIGFDKVFVITNDCTDGTDFMADRLAQMGQVIHLRNQIDPGEPPQVAGMRQLFADPRLADVAWLLHCDGDEFLNVTTGGGKVTDLLDAVGRDCDAIAVMWRVFGSDGVKDYEPCLVTERYTDRSPKPTAYQRWHKTMFRPDKFGWARDHMPKDPVDLSVRLRNTAGLPMSINGTLKPRLSRYRDSGDAWTMDNACLHHYATLAEDLFLLKNVRGDGMALVSTKYHLNERTWRAWNASGQRDTSMNRHLPALRERRDVYRADPVLAFLDVSAQDWFRRMVARHLTPENRAAWTIDPNSPIADRSDDQAR